MSAAQRKSLLALEARIERLERDLVVARKAWAELVEEAGQAAVARELGLSRQAVAERLKRIRTSRRPGLWRRGRA